MNEVKLWCGRLSLFTCLSFTPIDFFRVSPHRRWPVVQPAQAGPEAVIKMMKEGQEPELSHSGAFSPDWARQKERGREGERESERERASLTFPSHAAGQFTHCAQIKHDHFHI